eukprot:6192785-Pleurochrysis_carterae.AAC.2
MYVVASARSAAKFDSHPLSPGRQATDTTESKMKKERLATSHPTEVGGEWGERIERVSIVRRSLTRVRDGLVP